MVTPAELFQLPVAERLALVEDLWDSIARDAEDLEVSPELLDELNRRAQEHYENPDAGVTWEELDARLANLK
jgi:putative addiction module component (TIGR02574 family)